MGEGSCSIKIVTVRTIEYFLPIHCVLCVWMVTSIKISEIDFADADKLMHYEHGYL